ncbi:MAG: DapH/DapD/GlmU-related protein [Desulfobacterales bacterium]|nr:DapH/DapD/GlmU-related protein [Desulfobacterales bacterium]
MTTVRMKNFPRKIIRRCAGIVQKFRIAYYAALSSDARIQGRLKKSRPLLIAGEGTIVINGIATVGYFPSPFYFNSYAHFDLRNPNAHIEIGDGVIFNNNSTLIADGATISIGADALIGLNVTVMTSDAHGLEPEKRRSLDFPRENVSIGDNVFIGNDVTILKGVSIGNNSVIGNGSIVVDNIPGNVIAAGLPCRVIKAF